LTPIAALLIERGRYAAGIFGYCYIASVALRLSLGVAEDRQTGQDLLMSNFASAWQRMSAKLTALLLRELLVFVLAAVVAALVWGSLRTGAWYLLQFTFVACLLLPIVAAVELSTGVRTPGAVAVLVAFVALLLTVQSSSVRTVFAWIGLTQSAGSFAALQRLSLNSLAAVMLTILSCWLWTLARRDTRA
jgi:hypothetical protein